MIFVGDGYGNPTISWLRFRQETPATSLSCKVPPRAIGALERGSPPRPGNPVHQLLVDDLKIFEDI